MHSLRKAVDKALSIKAASTAASTGIPTEEHPEVLENSGELSTVATNANETNANETNGPMSDASLDNPTSVSGPKREQTSTADAPTESTEPDGAEDFDPEAILQRLLAERSAKKESNKKNLSGNEAVGDEIAADKHSPPDVTPEQPPEGSSVRPAPTNDDIDPAKESHGDAPSRPATRRGSTSDGFELLLANNPQAAQVGAGPEARRRSIPTSHPALDLKEPKSAASPPDSPNRSQDAESDSETPATNDSAGDVTSDKSKSPDRSFRNWFSPKPADKGSEQADEDQNNDDQ